MSGRPDRTLGIRLILCGGGADESGGERLRASRNVGFSVVVNWTEAVDRLKRGHADIEHFTDEGRRPAVRSCANDEVQRVMLGEGYRGEYCE